MKLRKILYHPDTSRCAYWAAETLWSADDVARMYELERRGHEDFSAWLPDLSRHIASFHLPDLIGAVGGPGVVMPEGVWIEVVITNPLMADFQRAGWLPALPQRCESGNVNRLTMPLYKRPGHVWIIDYDGLRTPIEEPEPYFEEFENATGGITRLRRQITFAMMTAQMRQMIFAGWDDRHDATVGVLTMNETRMMKGKS